jgi:SAM-dependent methyltransferase
MLVGRWMKRFRAASIGRSVADWRNTDWEAVFADGRQLNRYPFSNVVAWHAKNWLAAEDLTADLRVGDMTALPWPDESFDAVIDRYAVATLMDQRTALREIARVLRPDGRFFSTR